MNKRIGYVMLKLLVIPRWFTCSRSLSVVSIILTSPYSGHGCKWDVWW